jgi:predicted DNA-binding protein YlxM (UPF0122 family)
MRDLMEKKVEAALLNGYYGPLLTENQSEMLKLYCDEDYSLTEIAQQYAVSRQSVYDTLNRAILTLSAAEEKLHWASASENRQKELRKLFEKVEALPVETSGRTAKEEILTDLKKLLSEEEQYGV